MQFECALWLVSVAVSASPRVRSLPTKLGREILINQSPNLHDHTTRVVELNLMRVGLGISLSVSICLGHCSDFYLLGIRVLISFAVLT